jgi:hypothetical protein
LPVFMSTVHRVDFWGGVFASRTDLDEYFDEQYDDDDAPISTFAADMGERFYDHDSTQRSLQGTSSSDMAALLKGHSHAESYAVKTVENYLILGIGLVNTVVADWNEEIEQPISVEKPDRRLNYLGRFES